jgi:hypothetical protein
MPGSTAGMTNRQVMGKSKCFISVWLPGDDPTGERKNHAVELPGPGQMMNQGNFVYKALRLRDYYLLLGWHQQKAPVAETMPGSRDSCFADSPRLIISHVVHLLEANNLSSFILHQNDFFSGLLANALGSGISKPYCQSISDLVLEHFFTWAIRAHRPWGVAFPKVLYQAGLGPLSVIHATGRRLPVNPKLCETLRQSEVPG